MPWDILSRVCVLAYQKKKKNVCVQSVFTWERSDFDRLTFRMPQRFWCLSHFTLHFQSKQMKHYNMPWWAAHKLCYNKQNCRAMIFLCAQLTTRLSNKFSFSTAIWVRFESAAYRLKAFCILVNEIFPISKQSC